MILRIIVNKLDYLNLIVIDNSLSAKPVIEFVNITAVSKKYKTKSTFLNLLSPTLSLNEIEKI